MTPVDIWNTPPSMTHFALNASNGDGYALWNNGSALQISEFMNAMGHFMTRADVGEGHVPHVLANAAGDAFMVAQTHMMGGFGIDLRSRTGVGAWSGPAQVHRMDMSGEPAKAIECYREAGKLYARSGEDFEAIRVRVNTGGCYVALGKYREGIRLLRESLNEARNAGYRRLEALAWSNLGAAYYRQGDRRRARGCFLESDGRHVRHRRRRRFGLRMGGRLGGEAGYVRRTREHPVGGDWLKREADPHG